MVNRPRSSSAAGASQRASIACQSCRLRKVKCDAQSTTSAEGCGPCQRAGQECLFDPLSDGRRYVSRKFVDKLQQRIETLEALNERGAGNSSRTSDQGDAGPVDAHVAVSPASSNGAQAGSAFGNIAPSWNNESTASLSQIAANNTSRNHKAVSVTARHESPENLNGQSPSFYGATSHPHVASPGNETRFSYQEDSELVNIDLDPGSPRLRDHLFQSFFRYQTLWVDIVDRETFQTHQASQTKSQWYSHFLESAMLACATRLSTSKSVRAMGSKYSELAKDEVQNAMSDPTPANLKGFLLLSEYEVTQGNNRLGWMFCGVACRMLSDLGLHELVTAVGTTKVSRQESDRAYALLSACIVYEGVWTLYLGRPSSIPKSVIRITASRCKARRESDSPWLNAWVGLCVPMAEISQTLNDQSIADSHRTALLRQFFDEMEQWHENLPPELAYKENRLTGMDPAGYGLHTQFCKLQILVMRALSKQGNTRKRRYSQMARTDDDPHAIILHYAQRTARLVVTYREAFGLEKIPSIMLDNAVVAATAMIQHCERENASNSSHQNNMWLRQLVKSLELVQPHFPIVGRMLDSLKSITGNETAPGTQSSTPDPRTAPSSVPQPAIPRTSSGPLPGPVLENNSSLSNLHSRDVDWEDFDLERVLSDFTAGRFDDPTASFSLSDAFMPNFTPIPPLN